MCLILVAWQAHPEYPLVVAANRDEFFKRPTATACFWPGGQILAGRDLEAGGTWLGITRRGRFAAITNFRQPDPGNGLRSRGLLVTDYLRQAPDDADFLANLRRTRSDYRPYNLLFGTGHSLSCYASQPDRSQPLAGGLHALSNHLLDTPWPKVVRAKQALQDLLQSDRNIKPDGLFAIMRDETPADDAVLPDTGVGLARERALSSIFIRADGYGTRSTTVILIDDRGQLRFRERSFHADGEMSGECRFDFTIPPGSGFA
jgi:uncharacterized protein with NRDE domain